jgi:predicted NUDIX family NTP pyrophosphohydrolase
MPPTSAAIAAIRVRAGTPEILLVHPGGPFWAKKDEGAWSLPKGLLEPGEDPLAAALREWAEETGFALPPAPHVALGEIVQKSGKRVLAWAAHAEVDPAALRSNEIDIEWPPRSGRTLRIPEVDRAAYFALEVAEAKVNAGQLPLVERALSAATLVALGLG